MNGSFGISGRIRNAPMRRIGVGEDGEGETNALPCVLLIQDGASLPRRREVEIGGKNDACDEMFLGSNSHQCRSKPGGLGLGGSQGYRKAKRERRQADRLTVCKLY